MNKLFVLFISLLFSSNIFSADFCGDISKVKYYGPADCNNDGSGPRCRIEKIDIKSADSKKAVVQFKLFNMPGGKKYSKGQAVCVSYVNFEMKNGNIYVKVPFTVTP